MGEQVACVNLVILVSPNHLFFYLERNRNPLYTFYFLFHKVFRSTNMATSRLGVQRNVGQQLKGEGSFSKSGPLVEIPCKISDKWEVPQLPLHVVGFSKSLSAHSVTNYK